MFVTKQRLILAGCSSSVLLNSSRVRNFDLNKSYLNRKLSQNFRIFCSQPSRIEWVLVDLKNQKNTCLTGSFHYDAELNSTFNNGFVVTFQINRNRYSQVRYIFMNFSIMAELYSIDLYCFVLHLKYIINCILINTIMELNLNLIATRIPHILIK